MYVYGIPKTTCTNINTSLLGLYVGVNDGMYKTILTIVLFLFTIIESSFYTLLGSTSLHGGRARDDQEVHKKGTINHLDACIKKYSSTS